MMLEHATTRWIRVARLEELWEGEMTDVQIGDEFILIAHLSGGDIRAYQGHCPHQSAALSEGNLDGHILTCAAHLWQFNLSTGEGVNPKGCQLHGYQVRIKDATIYVGMP